MAASQKAVVVYVDDIATIPGNFPEVSTTLPAR